MLTLFIIFAIVALCFCAKKKKHNTEQDQSARINYPSFSVKAKPMGTVSKFFNLAYKKSELLDSVSYNNGRVTIKMQNGKELIGELSQLYAEFDKVNGLITYKVKSPSTKVSFYKTSNISDDEWKIITGMLCLAGTTRGEYVFGNTFKNLGYASTAIKILNKL